MNERGLPELSQRINKRIKAVSDDYFARSHVNPRHARIQFDNVPLHIVQRVRRNFPEHANTRCKSPGSSPGSVHPTIADVLAALHFVRTRANFEVLASAGVSEHFCL